MFYGIEIPVSNGKWGKVYRKSLGSINLKDEYAQESMNRLFEEYDFLCEQIAKQEKLIKKLSQTEKYRDRLEILQSIPGIGLITGMEILLELQDLSRFKRADQIAAYVGLTPSQYSSSDKIRMGRITKVGKSNIRALLVESSWILITKDEAMKIRYDKLKVRVGGKRAIVAIARSLIIRIRRMLLDNRQYVVGLVT
ncbi:MAG: transposase [Spirochaetota bacterium]|nr:transposase [Spirochaetota bacterium]